MARSVSTRFSNHPLWQLRVNQLILSEDLQGISFYQRVLLSITIDLIQTNQKNQMFG